MFLHLFPCLVAAAVSLAAFPFWWEGSYLFLVFPGGCSLWAAAVTGAWDIGVWWMPLLAVACAMFVRLVVFLPLEKSDGI